MERRDEAFRMVEDPALLRASELASLILVPMALQAAINLKVLNILAHHHQQQEEKGEPILNYQGLSAPEIALRMNQCYRITASSHALERILRLLASHGIFNFSQHVEKDEGEDNTSQGAVFYHTKYALNSVSKYFIPQGDDDEEEKIEEEGKEEAFLHTKECPPSHAPLLSLFLGKNFMKTWPFLEESILDTSLAPFTRAHGKDIYTYSHENPQFGMLINSAMGSLSENLFASLLENYRGFSCVNSLVDVGGGVGSCIKLIVSKYPHISGINFDQPHVVATAPQYPGIQHVGGDMFESVPNGEAILIKGVLHNWSDKDCIKILENCYKALPKDGKVIVLEYVVPSNIDTQACSRVAYQYDLIMFASLEDGKERTIDELSSLSKAARFSSLRQVCKINEMALLELHK